LVEPDDQAAVPLIKCFRQRGWIVHRARRACEALVLVERMSFAGVLIEVNLPDAVGTDVWFQIKRLHPKLHGIMITRSPSLHRLIDALNPNILAYLLKPLDLEAVCKLLQRTLEEGEQQEPLGKRRSSRRRSLYRSAERVAH
jgi:DNA-binding NtrC family response regulator